MRSNKGECLYCKFELLSRDRFYILSSEQRPPSPPPEKSPSPYQFRVSPPSSPSPGIDHFRSPLPIVLDPPDPLELSPGRSLERSPQRPPSPPHQDPPEHSPSPERPPGPQNPPPPQERPHRIVYNRRRPPLVDLDELSQVVVLPKLRHSVQFIEILKNASLDDLFAKMTSAMLERLRNPPKAPIELNGPGI